MICQSPDEHFCQKFKRNMRDNKHASAICFGKWHNLKLSRLCEDYFAKHVIQASTASSHRVGKCIFEPSKQSRIRKSSFWSHRRSTVHWETALSSKERSRRVNCPMLVHYNTNYQFTMKKKQIYSFLFIFVYF